MPGERRIVLVVGPGRSGTSTMAGALAQCGYEVPRAIEGDATNPLGFFEPQWVVDLHTRLLRKAGVGATSLDLFAVLLTVFEVSKYRKYAATSPAMTSIKNAKSPPSIKIHFMLPLFGGAGCACGGA